MDDVRSWNKKNIFCIAPFVNFSTTTDGLARLCCQSTASTDINLLEHDVDSIWNHQYYEQARNSFRNNQWPESCSMCKNLESKDIKSRRELENRRWAHLNWDELKKDPKIYCFDLRLGNQCNLKCIMCTPKNSTTWYEDYKKIDHLKEWQVLPGLQWALKGDLLDDIINHIDNVELLYFSGGEPLLNKKHNFILNYLIDKKLSHNVSLIYDTNGTQISKKHIELWHAFKKVSLNFSIDGTYEIDEYIRYPIKFDDVLTKFNLLKNTGIEVRLQCALGAHNLLDIPNIFTLQEEYNFAGVNISVVHWPECMQIKYLSDSTKIKCKKEFNKLNNKRLQDMLSALELTNNNPIELQKYFTQLDKIRNTNHKKIFPWIYK